MPKVPSRSHEARSIENTKPKRDAKLRRGRFWDRGAGLGGEGGLISSGNGRRFAEMNGTGGEKIWEPFAGGPGAGMRRAYE
jgi:hypothetical protein